MGFVEYEEDSIVVGIDPTEKEKGCCMVNMKVDKLVEMACPIMISALRVEEDPGELADKSLRMLTARSWVLGFALMTAPMFGFCS